MPAHQLFVHLAWTTRDRRPMIDAATRAFLEAYFRRVAVGERVELLALAILQTHVHLLVKIAARVDLPRLVQLMKGGSSYSASRLPENTLGLRWAREYSATTVGPKQIDTVVRYLERQKEHHPGEGITH
ncbi:MAG: IS200/IS605 family transposase [Gemmatimonadetes bacterium]|nr:IS200/IS605 family transposase [Gemmatimonadota bacterium]